jgi:alpha-glucosidase
MIVRNLFVVASLLAARASADLTPGVNEMCDGYAASNVEHRLDGLSADLKLIGAGCAIYGPDLSLLKLAVNYDTSKS